MDKLRQVVFLSVGRAIGFSGLGILTLMAGLSFDPILALQSGGILILLLLAVLLLKAHRMPFTNHRHTEAWLLLDLGDRPDDRYAAQVMQTTLRDAYLRFARWTAGVAVIVWSSAVLLAVTGADFTAAT